MKKSNIAVLVMLLILVCIGWGIQITKFRNNNTEFQTRVAQAINYSNNGLYQKAIEEFEGALAIREVKEIRNLWLDAYRCAYDDGVISAKKYGNAIYASCELYSDDVAYWERLLDFYLETGSYTTAYEYYLKSEKAGVVSVKLTELSYDIKYHFSVSRKTYSEFYRSPSGYYTVKDVSGWGVIDPTGERIYDCEYVYISPYNENGVALYVSERGTRLIDNNGVVESILPVEVSRSGAFGEGKVPVYTEEDTWRYLDCDTGEYSSETYSKSSNYINGYAMVCQNQSWSLIDIDGNTVNATVYDNVKLYGNGDFSYRDVIIAAENGLYGIYDCNGNSKAEFSCLDADVYLGELIAFQDSTGKWGYVNTKGEIVIMPQFDAAKSFSNGLAAVCVGEKWGFIDDTGAIVIDPQFRDADYFTSDGVCFVSSVENEFYMITLRFWEG